MDGRTEGRTDGRTEGQTDGWTIRAGGLPYAAGAPRQLCRYNSSDHYGGSDTSMLPLTESIRSLAICRQTPAPRLVVPSNPQLWFQICTLLRLNVHYVVKRAY